MILTLFCRLLIYEAAFLKAPPHRTHVGPRVLIGAEVSRRPVRIGNCPSRSSACVSSLRDGARNKAKAGGMHDEWAVASPTMALVA